MKVRFNNLFTIPFDKAKEFISLVCLYDSFLEILDENDNVIDSGIATDIFTFKELETQ